MSERTETRRRQRQALATKIVESQIPRSCDLDEVTAAVVWLTCRRCYQPFRTTGSYSECFACWLEDNPTKVA